MTSMRFEHYNLAVFERDLDTMQIFAAGRSFIDMIEFQRDTHGEEYWNVTKNIFEMQTPPNASFAHEIFLAKNNDYLVYKLTSLPRLYTMGLCDRQYIFNATTNQCTPCPAPL